jgi:prepilin-type processing-associated H-X9-DG protein
MDVNTYIGKAIKENAVAKPSETVAFGEKKNVDLGAPIGRVSKHFYMDLLEPESGGSVGNDGVQVERGCHSTLRPGTVSRSGGSNFAFTDGSARFLKFGKEVWPDNLWAVAEEDRKQFAWQP